MTYWEMGMVEGEEEKEEAKRKRREYIEKRKEARLVEAANHPVVKLERKKFPIPEEKRGGERTFQHFYPFEKMRVGDSFWVPGKSKCTWGAVTSFAKKSGWKFVSRAQSEEGVDNKKCAPWDRGTRVWRVE